MSSNPIVVSSGSSGPKVVLKKGVRRWRCTKVDTKPGKDMKGNPITKIRFHLRHEDAFALKSVSHKWNPKSYLYQWIAEAAPQDFEECKNNTEMVWSLCQDLVGREWDLLTEPDGDWNNVVNVVECHGKVAPAKAPTTTGLENMPDATEAEDL